MCARWVWHLDPIVSRVVKLVEGEHEVNEGVHLANEEILVDICVALRDVETGHCCVIRDPGERGDGIEEAQTVQAVHGAIEHRERATTLIGWENVALRDRWARQQIHEGGIYCPLRLGGPFPRSDGVH